MGIPRNPPVFFTAAFLCLSIGLPLVAVAQDQTDATPPPAQTRSQSSNSSQANQVLIPGPLRSFLRMAGISQKLPPEDVLPELARSVYALGFRGGQETEYLLLLQRYVRQARELQALAGPNGDIRVVHCEDAGPLLQLLGYHLRNTCGHKDASLATLNPERAFLTIDSGFPLTRLEIALQTDTPFIYPFNPSRVPVLLRQNDWTGLSAWRKTGSENLLDVLLHEPRVARLYWAFSKMDMETDVALQHSAGLWNLLPYASTLDFYGTQLCIRSKKVLVPGGAAAEAGWRDMVGASPESPGDFVLHLLQQDRGWMALYYDTLARVNAAQQAHLTQSPRLNRMYEAFRETAGNTPAASASFRKAPGLLILFNRQEWLPDGQPRIPGNVDVWKTVLGKHSRHASSPEQVLEAMVASSRFDSEDGPLQVYLSLSAVDGERPPRSSVSPETLLLMAKNYSQYGSWYSTFAEFPALDDNAVTHFIRVAETVDHISNQDLRGDALGIMQANLSLWQILARQGEIPSLQLNASWQRVIDPFEKIDSSAGLFDAGGKSLGEIMVAATGKSNLSQDEIVELLAGPSQDNAPGKKVHAEMARRMRLVMDDQRLTSLDTLLELGRGLTALQHGAIAPDKLLPLAGDLREFEMPRPLFTETEKFEWAPGVLSRHHAELQVHTDLTKVIGQPHTPAKLEAARGQLTPFLRDTLVGLSYAYYEPPGSQILHINPLFVRSHDFAGTTVVGEDHIWQPSTLFGTGVSAGGGAYLVGSLSDLPYVLAATEQNFIAPENVQALIWQELVPSLLASSTLSRWWNVGPQELRAVALYQRSGEELLTASAGNRQLRDKLTAILSDRMSPQRLQRIETDLQLKDPGTAISRLMPADTFYLAVEYRHRFPQEIASAGASNQALDSLIRQAPTEVGLERISKDFGIPHPILAQTYGRELVNGKPFPAFSGYSNRLFGESWDSNNLYWARLADQRNDSPQTLNLLSPQLTRVMISKIFATDIEDWSAVSRAMRETGDELSHGKVVAMPSTETAQR